MIIVIGEVLIDQFETYHRIGGAPFNFAFHMKQLGFPVRLLTRVGDDPHGRDSIDRIQSCGLDADDVQTDTLHPTGTVNVILDDNGIPTFDIRRDVAYDYLDFKRYAGLEWSEVRMIYMGTLAQRTVAGFQAISGFLAQREPQASVFFDVNLRPPHINSDAIAVSLENADIVKLNEDELEAVMCHLSGPVLSADSARWLMKRLSLQWLVVTRGESGSTIYSADQVVQIGAAVRGRVVDTVGAGDAYAAVMAAGFLRGIPVKPLAGLATQFAAHVCTLPGAIPEQTDIYRHILQEAERVMDGK